MKYISAVLAALVLTAIYTTTHAEQATKVLRFTAIPDRNTTELKQKFDPVADYLSERLGIRVEYVPAADYQASVEMFKNGDVQLAWFGGLTGVQARRAVPGARAIAQGVEDPQYYSYFVAHASTGLERSDEFPLGISSLPFTFGSESSTSGRLMPEYFIRRETGKGPAEFFEKPYGFSGSHPKTAELVAEGTTIKAGVLNYKTYDTMVASGKIDPKICRIIWKTPTYADYNFTVHPDVDSTFRGGTIARLQNTLVGMTDPELLAAFQRDGLIEARNEDFAGIQWVAVDLGMVRTD